MLCCALIILALSQHLCLCVGVLMWWCSVRVQKPVVSVVASVTLTDSPSTQELLSHAGCFCQCWAEAVTPQRFMAAAGCCCSCTCIFPAEMTAPCWLLSKVKRFISWRDLDFYLGSVRSVYGHYNTRWQITVIVFERTISLHPHLIISHHIY